MQRRYLATAILRSFITLRFHTKSQRMGHISLLRSLSPSSPSPPLLASGYRKLRSEFADQKSCGALSMSGVHAAARARNIQLSQIFEPTTRSKLTSQSVFSCICKRRVLSLLSKITVFTVIPSCMCMVFWTATIDLGSGAVGGFVSSLSIPQDMYATPQKHTIQTAVYMVSR